MADLIEIIHRRLQSSEGVTKTREELEHNVTEFYQGGMSQRAIAELYGITQGYVSRILKHRRIPTRKPSPKPKVKVTTKPKHIQRDTNGRFKK